MEFCGRINGADEGHDPLGEGAAIDRDKGQKNAHENRQAHERPFEKANQGKAINNNGGQNSAGQLKKLFKGHVSYEPKLVRRNILWYRVLVHLLQSNNKPSALSAQDSICRRDF